jgi:tetratricopeptide (TPR) repeat protein
VATAANLAWDLLQRKQFTTARKLFRQVLIIRDHRLRWEHPDTQTTRGNIAWLTYEQGEPGEATHRLTRLVQSRQRTLRAGHPRILTTRHNLALSLRSQRDYDAAVDEFREILAVQEEDEDIGRDHESTLSTRYNLAVTLRLRDGRAAGRAIDVGAAIDLLDELLDEQLAVYSSRHPAITQTREELIAALRQRGLAFDLDRANDERTPSRTAAALSRHRTEPEYDDEPEVFPDQDPLLAPFLTENLDAYVDRDLDGYVPSRPGDEAA